MQGRAPGRASVRVSFTDGSTHVSSFHVLPPFDVQLARHGRFCAETAWCAERVGMTVHPLRLWTEDCLVCPED